MTTTDPQPTDPAPTDQTHDGPPRNPVGGGALFVLCLFLGVGIGYALYQPTIGFLVGGAVGIAVMLLLAWRERERP